jgi:glycosyltransferase involved in cell wall biosynthesis
MANLKRKLKTASRILRERGWSGIKTHLNYKIHHLKEKRAYQDWIKTADTLTDDDRQKILAHIERFSYKPLISVVMPVYNIEEKWLRLCIESVLRQLYQNWEFCIADDCSTKPHIKEILNEYAKKDSRIKVIFREKNGHISAASNSALEIAEGDFIVLLDHDDELSEHALYFVVNELNRFPETKMIYSDEDMIDEKGKRYAPKFKPDWSRDLFYSLNLITHLSAYETSLLKKIGGFRIGMEGSQDYDLALRVVEEIEENQIRHIPRILYHWRAVKGSVALDLEEKPYAHECARDAIRQHFQRTGIKAKVEEGYKPLHRVIYDSKESFEVIKTKNATASLLNSLAENSSSDVLIFVDENIEEYKVESFAELSRIAAQKSIGAVGGKILNKDFSVRNGGIILGANGLFGFAHQGFPTEATGIMVRSQVINNFSAVSGVLAIKRSLFLEMDGFNSEDFNKSLFEIDLCLRLLEKGYRNVFTPYAEFFQEGKSVIEKLLENQGLEEVKKFQIKWKKFLERDSFYNENLSLKDSTFSLEMPAKIKQPWNS